jgi:hypothetical protein
MKRSKSRLRKVECGQCGCILYGSAAALSQGLPGCACGGSFTVPKLADLEVIDPDGFEALLEGLSERAFHAAMRELGYTDMIRAKQPPRRTQQPQCGHDGCSHFRRYGTKYCATHEELEAVPF